MHSSRKLHAPAVPRSTYKLHHLSECVQEELRRTLKETKAEVLLGLLASICTSLLDARSGKSTAGSPIPATLYFSTNKLSKLYHVH